MSKEPNRLGTNPLGGALDWLEAPAPVPAAEPASVPGSPASPPGTPAEINPSDSLRRGVAAGYRRHTLLMRDDQIEQLDRLVALDRLEAGERARNKKELVEQAFDLFFRSAQGKPQGK